MTIDRVFLGHYSTDSLGAAIGVFGLFWTFMALLQQTAAYVATFVAQYFGAKKTERLGPALWQSLHVSWIGGLLFLSLIPLAPTLFDWVGHSERIRILEVDYFQTMCFSAMPTAVIAAVSGFFMGLGKTKTLLWLNGTALAFNVLFDFLFIFGHAGFPEMGIVGAGIATALASWASALLGLALLFSPKLSALYQTRTAWRWDSDLMKRFLKFGIPSGLQWSLEGLAFTMFLVFVGQMPNGDAALSASGIAVTILMLAILPALGVGQAVTIFVGQYLGNDRPQEAEDVTWTGLQVASTYIFIVGMSFWIFPEFYLSWFEHSEQSALWLEVQQIVPTLLTFVSGFVLFDAMNMIFSFTLKGAGDTRFVTLVALTIPWPIMVFPAYLARNSEIGVYYAWAAASVFIATQALIFLVRFRKGQWKSMRVIEGETN